MLGVFLMSDTNTEQQEKEEAVCFIPARPLDAQVTPPSNPTTPGFVILVFALILLPFLGYYMYLWSQAGTTINTTITENDDLESGLILHYTFDGGEVSWSTDSATTTDRSGNGYNGTYYGSGPAQDVIAGRTGQALKFKGQYITAGDVNAVDTLTAATFCSWMKHDSITSDDSIIAKNSGVGGFKFFRDETTTGKRDVYALFVAEDTGAGGSINTVESAASTTPQNTWVHVCGSFAATSATGLKLYINGDLVSTASASGIDNINGGSQDLEIGLGFDGTIDDNRIYNRALSASEVTRLYELGATTHINTTIDTNDDLENGLVGHWTFDGPNMNIGSGTREVIDTSGSGNHGDWKNHATTTVAGKLGQGILFDGTDDFISMGSGDIPFTKTSAFSGTAWIKTRNTGAISSNWEYIASSGWVFAIGIAGANSVEFGLLNDVANAGRYQMGSTNVLDGQWHFISFTYDGSNTVAGIKLYTDGGLEGMSTFRNSDPGTLVDNDLRIAATEGLGTGEFEFDGTIDDVRIYNRALATSTIKRLYELGATTHINTTIDTNDELENGLVGHWTFDGPKMAWGSSTAEVLDSSASSIEGDMVNMDQQSATAGKMGQGLKFDGSNDSIVMSPVSLVSSTFTASLWAKIPTTGTGAGYLFDYRLNNSLIAFRGDVFNDIFIRDASSNTPTPSQPSVTYPKDNQWHHYVITADGTNVVSFKDGVQISTNSFSSSISASSELSIGRTGAGGLWASASIDDVRVYNRALSASEVTRLYELGGGR